MPIIEVTLFVQGYWPDSDSIQKVPKNLIKI